VCNDKSNFCNTACLFFFVLRSSARSVGQAFEILLQQLFSGRRVGGFVGSENPAEPSFILKQFNSIAIYINCFALFRKYKKYLIGVTCWNVSDKKSWLDNFPVKDRKDYPLMFDKNLQPKKAYCGVKNKKNISET
jgi:hypothetical protein